MKAIIIFIILLFYLSDTYIYCISDKKVDTVTIKKYPINIYQVNSIYDDFNSAIRLSPIFQIQRLIFSTNRYSEGNNFDLISYRLNLMPINSNQDTYDIAYIIRNDNILNDLSIVNSNCNEFGPYYIKLNPTFYKPGLDSVLFFITKDCNGHLDIFHNKYKYYSFSGVYENMDMLKEIRQLNTDYDEGYVSISTDFMHLYFCTNRKGDFNIMELTDTSGADIYQILYDSSDFQINDLKHINSNYDDKCPFIHWNNYMVFCSNRPGGYGGYDLYYSIKKNQQWSIPINFGEKINTQFDEYRPIIIEGRFMIFSSNRPEGMGGYDLYIVEIEW